MHEADTYMDLVEVVMCIIDLDRSNQLCQKEKDTKMGSKGLYFIEGEKRLERKTGATVARAKGTIIIKQGGKE